MSHAQSPMTSEEFLAWEEQQELKWEFDGFHPVAMTGTSFAHNTIQGNILASLKPRLRAGSCRVVGPEMRVPTGQGRYRYPDAVVSCSEAAARDRDLTDPIVIFEVLSESTAATDRTVKLVEYRSIPSLRRYIMLEQDRAFATVLTRADHGWSLETLRLEDTLSLPEIAADVPMAELYLDTDPLPLER